MTQAIVRKSALALAILLTAVLLLIITTRTGQAEPALGPAPAAITWSRTLEPVILTGSNLPLLQTAPLDELFVYRYSGGAWQPIPFQFDEINASGEYTTTDPTEGGLLDANDELVFMARDIGDQAPSSSWVNDLRSKLFTRYEVQVTNPITPTEQGWVYVYRSSTLSPSANDYVQWVSPTVQAETYVLGFDPAFVTPADWELNDSGKDALDRAKMRFNIDCGRITETKQIALTEQSEEISDSARPTPKIDGAVRAGGGDMDSFTWYYASLQVSKATFSIGDMTSVECSKGITVTSIRWSNDWLTPTVSGMSDAGYTMTYYNPNKPDGVPVDGAEDGVAGRPVVAWHQVSGAQGSVVSVQSVNAGGGQMYNWYHDTLSEIEPATGDGEEYGDYGFLVNNPTSDVVFSGRTFVLAAKRPNVGSTYQQYANQPPQVVTTAQKSSLPMVYLPLLMRRFE